VSGRRVSGSANVYLSSSKTKIAAFNSLCRYNNAEAVLQSLLSHRGTPICLHHNRDNFIHACSMAPHKRQISAMQSAMVLPFFTVKRVWKIGCSSRVRNDREL
jgi:hypothetical protein